jgi:hypothetical protein
MGLGKTFQIIAVLITLSLLPADARVEMPAHLRKENRRYLVVCPPGIVENWKKEFKRWTPENCYDALGMIYCVNQISLAQRMYTIKRWYDNGGVLISKYPLASSLIGSWIQSISHPSHSKTWNGRKSQQIENVAIKARS